MLGVLALYHNTYVFFATLVIAAIITSPRAWLYTLGVSIGMLALKLGNFPSWNVLSFVLIALAYSLMSKIEEREESRIPPELLYYYILGGGGRTT